MRIKEAGKRLQLVRTTYEPESRRGVDKMIASVSSDVSNIPVDVLPLLTPEEVEQVTYLLRERHLRKKKIASKTVLKSGFVESGHLAIWALTHTDIVESLMPEEVINIWSMLEQVQLAMEKAKLPRPKES